MNKQFPPGFLWGAASAAYQVEEAAAEMVVEHLSGMFLPDCLGRSQTAKQGRSRVTNIFFSKLILT